MADTLAREIPLIGALVWALAGCGSSPAAVRDASVVDAAGAVDAAAGDAGPTDGAPRDAGVADAAAPDAAPPDAAAPDAAPADAGAMARHLALFVGNSYTFGNDLPGLYRSLVESHPAKPVELDTASITAGGRRLVQHAADAADDGHRLGMHLGEDGAAWTQVILQEQSQIPGFGAGQPDYDASLVAGAELARRIRAKGAEVVFFMTWGRRAGDATNPGRFPDFSTMQDRLEAGYRALAAAARAEGATVRIAPVGLAFAEIHAEDAAAGDPLDASSLFWRLYTSDGSHPSMHGSYLAACVFARAMLGLDLEAFTFVPNGVAPEDAARLRAAAARAVDGFR